MDEKEARERYGELLGHFCSGDLHRHYGCDVPGFGTAEVFGSIKRILEGAGYQIPEDLVHDAYRDIAASNIPLVYKEEKATRLHKLTGVRPATADVVAALEEKLATLRTSLTDCQRYEQVMGGIIEQSVRLDDMMTVGGTARAVTSTAFQYIEANRKRYESLKKRGTRPIEGLAQAFGFTLVEVLCEGGNSTGPFPKNRIKSGYLKKALMENDLVHL